MRELVYINILRIITLDFTYGERKICSTINKSPNIMHMIVAISIFVSLPFKLESNGLVIGNWESDPKVSDLNPHEWKIWKDL